MSEVSTLLRQGLDRDGPLVDPETAPTAVEFHYTQTDSFVALLHQLSASLLVSTYQANKLLVIRAERNGLSTLVRTFDRPMGLADDGRRPAVAAGVGNGVARARGPGHRRAADRGRAARLHPRSGVLRPLRLRWSVEDP